MSFGRGQTFFGEAAPTQERPQAIISDKAEVKTPLDQLFDKIDTNGRGAISKADFMAAVTSGVFAPPVVERQTQQHVVSGAELYRNFDFNEDGNVSRSQYMQGMQYIHAGGPPGSLVFGPHTLGCPHLPQAAAHALAQAGYAASATAGGWDGGGGVASVLNDQGSSGGRAYNANANGGGGGHSSGRANNGAGGAAGGSSRFGNERVVGHDVGNEGEIENRPQIRVPLPEPAMRGGRRFYGDVPVEQATFAYSELCASEDPECALAPQPEVAAKRWYNTYFYYPEDRRAAKEGGQFMERFVQGPNGEWLDIPKSRRMAGHIKETHERQEQERAEMNVLLAGASWQNTGQEGGGIGKSSYTDPYSGERLVSFEGKLQPMSELLKEHGVRRPMLAQATSQLGEKDFDNFRVPWPGGPPHRNKKISQTVYDRFDRTSPFVPSDSSYQILETPSCFVDRQDYGKWEELGGRSLNQFARDEMRDGRQFERGMEQRLAV